MRRVPTLPFGQAAIWAAVALAFADSSIVVLALPDLLRQLDTSISGVSLVITIYNAAVVVATPLVVWLVRRAGARACLHAGLILFAAGSAGCALSGSLELLVALRVVQALGGAFLLASALPTLGVRRWSVAAAVGAALGPAIGGLLTEALDWRAIFAFQAPVALAALLAGWRAAVVAELAADAARPRRPAGERRAGVALGRPRGRALPGRDPGDRGLGAVARLRGAARLGAARDDARGRAARARRAARPAAAAGAILVARGAGRCGAPARALARLARRRARARGRGTRHRRPVAVGAGARDGVDGTRGLVGRRAPSRARARPGARRAGARRRHRHATDRASEAGAGVVLDAPISARAKLQLGLDIASTLQAAPRASVPDFAPSFASARARDSSQAAALTATEHRLGDTVRAVLERGFRASLWICVALALLACAPLAWPQRRRPA